MKTTVYGGGVLFYSLWLCCDVSVVQCSFTISLWMFLYMFVCLLDGEVTHSFVHFSLFILF